MKSRQSSKDYKAFWIGGWQDVNRRKDRYRIELLTLLVDNNIRDGMSLLQAKAKAFMRLEEIDRSLTEDHLAFLQKFEIRNK